MTQSTNVTANTAGMEKDDLMNNPLGQMKAKKDSGKKTGFVGKMFGTGRK